ncbi:unnamed protein product [Phytophthora fragariaefolia]|uniref:Unnamed protein product n=1 Tax=Phytophthora fragariaefolia TaxID=1490495 RepID=A0A9W6XRS1_9STRA|nr:unnamed protein product [Phytophthora fragariaefolia]
MAFYTTVTNTQVHKLTFSAATVAAADQVKQRVLDIVLANLRYDAKLKRILQKNELRRIYPDDEPPRSEEAAAAMLFAHYTKMRGVSVKTSVPQTFWEGPTVLRAMTVYLQEPLYVWDVGADEAGYVQQYLYKSFTMDDGDTHETGVTQPLPEDRARDILEACYNHQVITTIRLLKHTEGHFYGVQHGDVFHEWHAQPGPDMRARLDEVYVGIPVLPSDGYDPDSVAAEAAYEEQALLEAMGVDFYASGSQKSAPPGQFHDIVARVVLAAYTDVHRSVYGRLLGTLDDAQRDAIHRRLATRLHSANTAALVEWIQRERLQYDIPHFMDGQPLWKAAMDWLIATDDALPHAPLLSFILN